ncbi:hypothetical protein UlMin_011755 [Ulmus minor]
MAAVLAGREFKRSVIDEGQEILRRLDNLLGQKIYLGLNARVPTRSLQTFDAPCVEESDVVGIDGDKEEIIELLLSNDTRGNNLSVIPIVGMGGIKKTTLTQLVYEDSRHKLKKALAGKIFLFVLDDVWNENYRRWDSLKSGFQSGAHGSKIIVTMRNKDVALTMSKRVMHELKLVSDEDCWWIFEKHAFDDSAKATTQLKEIGRKIVE